MGRIINVSNRLPVTVTESGIKASSGGLVAALEGFGGEGQELKWIGWPGSHIEDGGRRAEVERELAEKLGSAAVFMSREEERGFYEGFSNASLWPLLHYMPTYMRYESAWWDDYLRVNRRFADKVLEVAREDDLVWVHDYQLMLVPGMLREAMPRLRVGFFLHTPFPSYELFRYHPCRSELLEGMLGADLIGFHTFGYMRHFRSAVLRLLGVESEVVTIRRERHTTTLGVYPIGINAKRFEEELATDAYKAKLAELKKEYGERRLIVSVERMDYTKGILHRLDAIDLFLEKCEDRGRVKFLFVAVPSREGVEEYQELRQEVETRVGRLNGKYATLNNSPIHFIHGSVSFTELCALYSLAEVGVVTPLVDGMNLVAKEYVAAQKDEPGVLVLSEFAGAAEELFNATIVNPRDPGQVARAIGQALAMPREERAERMRPMRGRVMQYDARAWARSFVEDLSQQRPGERAPTKVGEVRERLREAFARRARVALFIDYDGTLRELEKNPKAAPPTPAIVRLLDKLAARRDHVDVTVISGRVLAYLEGWLGHYPFGLVAEHGAMRRKPGATEWEAQDRNIDYGWKEPLLKVLRLYELSTPGSWVEEKRTGLVWHYRQSDPEFGSWKAKLLMAELEALTASAPVHVRHGRKIIEVAATEVNKGAAVMRIAAEKTYDLILCAGDDVTDESMFRLGLERMVSVKVGEGPTQAQYVVESPREFRELIEGALG